MKGCLSVLLVGAVTWGLLATGGCLVPKSRLDRANVANEEANHRLAKAREMARMQLADNRNLQGRLQAREQALDAKDEQIALETTRYAALKGKLDELKVLYDKEMARGEGLDITSPLPVEVDRALRRFAEANSTLMEYLPKRGMIKMKSDLSFALGSAVVQGQAKQALKKIVEILQSQPASGLKALVAGHTDDVPIGSATGRRHPDNWYLSAHRAIAVLKVLVGAGLAPQRAAAVGFGEYQPIAPNRTGSTGRKLGNQANRRVEIWIVPANRFLTTSAAKIADK